VPRPIWPPYGRNGEPGKIRLGLDLQGGTYLVLQVLPDTPPAAGQPPVAPETMRDVIRALERR
jgi:preprotein translocase subunit SecD